MTSEAERWYLEADKAAFLRSCGEADALGLWPVLVAAWERLPVDVRVSLRGTFDVRIVGGRDAHVGVPAGLARDIAQPVITLGADGDDVGLSFAHELAHVYCGHCDASDFRGPARVFTWSLPPALRAVVLADGVPVVALDPDTLRREREAWELCAAWGFPVPAGVLVGVSENV